MAELRGEQVVLRPLTEADLPRVTAIQAQPSIAARWGEPNEADLRAKQDGTEGVVAYAIELDSEVVGLIEYQEEGDPMYGMRASTSSSRRRSRGAGSGPTQCARWRAISSTSERTTD